MNTFLAARLQPALARHRVVTLAWQLGVCWLLWALAGLVSLRWAPLPGWALVVWWLAGGLATLVLLLRWWLAPPDYRGVARCLERRFPELNSRLLTAVQVEEKGSPNFLEERLLRQTMQHSLERDWRIAVPSWQLLLARVLMAAGFAGLMTVAVQFRAAPTEAARLIHEDFAVPVLPPGEIDVTPGDTEVEKGSSLVVLARFGEPVPAAADLVIGHSAESERRIPLVKNFQDPVFGGSVPNVTEPLRYRVEAGDLKSREFTVTVFEYPRLERSDAELTYPAYTQLPRRRIEDTRHLSAVEGTLLDLTLQLNKPVARAVLQPRPRDTRREKVDTPTPPAEPIELTVDPAQARAVLSQFVLRTSGEFDLVLTDAEGRENKAPARFSFEALPNRPPEIKLARPRGDQRPSALEELVFEGTAWDDFGVLAYGIALGRAGAEPQFIELGRDVPAQTKQAFQHVWRLEEEQAEPDALFTWFTWADDLGPDGLRRRTTGDLFFAEIRPFEEIFRQGEAMGREEPSSPSSAQSGAAEQSAQLAELQKQIINATWKLQREVPSEMTEAFREDTETVRASQAEALAQAREAAQQANDPRALAGWQTAVQEMTQAEQALTTAHSQLPPVPELTVALAAEQRAYQALLRVQAREHEVIRSRQNSSSSSRQQSRQGELEQLDLTEEENRYETQRLASSPQENERREQMQVLNRLQELARRQEAVTERLKEVQAALAEAKTEEEREELRRELKRLEEEQRELLADADELNQRLERPENQQSLAEERQRMQEVRDQLQQAASATAEGDVPQAVASGTRAQRQLEEMRQSLRERNSSALQEALRDLRAEARDLARRQERLSAALDNPPPEEGAEAQDQESFTPPASEETTQDGLTNANASESSPRRLPELKTLSDDTPSEQAEIARQLAEQRQRTEEFIEKATALSEEAEAAEPLASRQLYDSVRQFVQEDTGSVKQLREEILREGRMTRDLYQQFLEWQEEESPGKMLAATAELAERQMQEEAARGGQRARAALEALRRGVEGATEKVLGDDTEALKRAERELAELTRELERELNELHEAAEEGETAGSERGERGAASQNASEGETSGDTRSSLAQAGSRQGQQATPSEDNEETGTGRDEADPEAERDAASGAGGRTAQAKTNRERGQNGGQNVGETAEPQDGQGEEGAEPQLGQTTVRGQGQGEPSGAENEDAAAAEREQDGPEGRGREGQPGARRGLAQRGSRNAPATPDGRGGTGPEAPLTGEGFAPWSDRLRDVEEMLEFPDLRSGVATARERARALRREYQRELKKPDWAVVELEVLRPLVEVRQSLREELARRSSEEALVPIDRDPVPSRYTELVRRYYEVLGRDESMP